MKLVFIAREGIAADYIAYCLAGEFDLRMLKETGAPARRRKLRRYFRLRNLPRWPLRLLDVLAVVFYHQLINRSLRRSLAALIGTHKPLEVRTCADVNDRQATEALQSWAPDLVLVYGTSLLEHKTLALCPLFLNLHGGMVPRYRNVHSEFWALARNEASAVGVSILYLTAGIDAGDVAFQQGLPSLPLTVREAVVENTKLTASLAIQAVQSFREGHLTRTPQDSRQVGRTFTPQAHDVLRALIFKKPQL